MKDFWPGQQQFANNLLGNGNDNSAIAPLVAGKNGASNVGASSMAHGPNVAKVCGTFHSRDSSSNNLRNSGFHFLSY